ncbi:hypothetical protein GCM10009555_033620 [Acrocarpospora macrocephala]|uniref:SnoaL-like domain-containing protein n=1 Tax=Acrocarpospora macrocephala TaxID=150177 RepID=A0A5M3WHG9_9ACTN|nr:nuclear transport factor 2 family protein [Acrocarpospora macrocephala]GES06543.1 hypothetical protein Amac_001380 [Acrocarpospora macrocephala]
MAISDIETVTQLVLHERQGRDRRWWDQMRAQYWPDATVHLSWFEGSAYENVDQSEAMNANGSVSTHRLSPLVVHVAGDRAIAELPTVIEAPITINDVDVVLMSSLRIQYRALRRDSEWRLLRLDTVYERDHLVVTTPGESVHVAAAELAPFRKPYRLLAWFLASRGYTVLDDLLGDDRPDEVAAFYERERRWLNES